MALCKSIVVIFSSLALVACAGSIDTRSAPVEAEPESSSSSESVAPMGQESELAGTSWELLKIQSMDDNAWTPQNPSRYTLTFDPDGSAYMQLDCNRGRTSWESEQAGQLTFGLVASTNALCQDDGLSERYASQFEFVRSYVMRDGHLFLATFADGAIIEFQPAE